MAVLLKHGRAVHTGNSDEVVSEGVGDVLAPVGGGSFRGGRALDENAEHGDHRKAAVLNLLDLEDGEVFGGRGDVEEVKGTARVDGVEAAKVGTFELAEDGGEAGGRFDLAGAETFNTSHQSNFNSSEDVGVAEDFGAAGFAVKENLTGLGPHAAGHAEGFGDHDTRDGEHGPPRVDNLRHAVLLNLAVRAEL